MIIPEYIELISEYKTDIEKLKKEYFSVQHMLVDRKRPEGKVLIQKALNLFSKTETPILKTIPYTREVVNYLVETYDFNTVCYRCILPDTCYSWHVDGGKNCLHIPVITNLGCRFVYEDKSYFMPADGSLYSVNTEKYHSFMNGGKTQRTHLTFENY